MQVELKQSELLIYFYVLEIVAVKQIENVNVCEHLVVVEIFYILK